MQMYALDHNRQIIFVRQAQRQYIYFCLECHSPLRVRGGFHRQLHFYHIAVSLSCRQGGKSMAHLQTQLYIQNAIDEEPCQLEKIFPSVNRIADVAWDSQKIIFEIQCSPISKQELLSRIEDYRSIGWQCIWILHDACFNQKNISAAELALAPFTHYFTNIDANREGHIYDQWQYIDQTKRIVSVRPFKIDIQKPMIPQKSMRTLLQKAAPFLSQQRESWALFFHNDLPDQLLHKTVEENPLLQKVLEIEQKLQKKAISASPLNLLSLIKQLLHFYRIFFQFILERFCR